MSAPLLRIRGDDGQMHPVPILGGQVKVGDTARLPLFTGEGGIAVARTAAEARGLLGVAEYERGDITSTMGVRGLSTPGTVQYDPTSQCTYVRIGDMVFVLAWISVTSWVGCAGLLTVYGLPYTAGQFCNGFASVVSANPQSPIAENTDWVQVNSNGTLAYKTDMTFGTSVIPQAFYVALNLCYTRK